MLVQTREYQDQYLEGIKNQQAAYEQSAKVFIIEYHCEIKVGRKIDPIFNAKACILAFNQTEAINELRTILETQYNGVLTEIPSVMELTKLPMVFSYAVKEYIVLHEGDKIKRNIQLKKEEAKKIVEKTKSHKMPTSKIIKDKVSTIMTKRPSL